MRVSHYLRGTVVGLSLAAGSMVVTLPAAYAQVNAVRGGISGVVTDPTGAAVPNAKVTISGPQATNTLATDSAGRYELTGLVPGMYKVTVSAQGFNQFASKDNEVTIDHTVNVNATLTLGSGAETIEVDASATQIDLENTSVNTAITDTLYEQLPLPRNVSGSFYLAPGVVSGGGTGTANPSIGGSTGLENLYVADGVTITDQAYGGLGVYTPQYGSLGTGINLSFVKEVDIKTMAFEPKYGQADGGVVEIVTKTGSNQYHGKIAAYIQPQFGFAAAKQPYQAGTIVTTPFSTLSTPSYELDAEIGGYVPGLRDKLFFFGSFDPTLTETNYFVNPLAPLAGKLGLQTAKTTAASWAAKLTYQPFATTLLEASTFGDPSRRNVAPESLSGPSTYTVSDSYNYGTRDSVVRINSAPIKWLTFSGSYSYSTEHFTDSPVANAYSISDRTSTLSSSFLSYGFGTYYKTKDANWVLQGDLQANSNFLGKHTTSIGYLFDHVDFSNATLRSGLNYAIPANNADGTSLRSLYSNVPAAAIGASTNASFYLKPNTDSAGNLRYGCTYCGKVPSATAPNGYVEVYLQQNRGTYSGTYVSALDRYKAAYGNEEWTINKYVALNAGLRWEQQTYGGSLLTYVWHDNWSPRLGLTVDPFGDRKSKVFFTYSRYQNPLPLDAAIRQLGNEQDDTSFYFAPKTDSSGFVTRDAYGSVQPVLTAALNGTQASSTGAKFGAPNFGSSTGEGILPGTKMEYSDEYVLGLQREVKPGMVASARYIDRHLGRIVEDNGSTSPEGSYVDANYAGGIANISASSDFFNNETEVTYTPAQFAAVNGGRTPDQTCDPSDPKTGAACAASGKAYVSPVAGCAYGNDTSVAYGGYFPKPSLPGQSAGTFNGACVTNAATNGASYGADGKPDGFADPRRHYQALELELNRSLRNNWQARINYRYSKLWGNYEGFFRNDNGQSDPGISSLFDFTQGALGLLGDQFKRGYLNTDHRHTANLALAYTIDKSTRFVGHYGSGITVGSYLHAASGAPLSAFQSHPAYLTPGEVPVGGRGTLGRLPTQIGLDMSTEDTIHLGDKYSIRGAFTAFNVTDSRMTITQNQNLDTSYGSPLNKDYAKATSWQQPFRCRFEVAFQF